MYSKEFLIQNGHLSIDRTDVVPWTLSFLRHLYETNSWFGPDAGCLEKVDYEHKQTYKRTSINKVYSLELTMVY